MKVIFLQDVPRVGKRHDIKEVNSGYAVNFLFPRKLAEQATLQAIASLEARKKNIAIEREVQTDLLMKNLDEIKDKTLHLKAKADEKGHLFKAIHEKDIIEGMRAEHKAEISEEYIALEKPIKAIGEFDIPVKVNGNTSSFKLVVETE